MLKIHLEYIQFERFFHLDNGDNLPGERVLREPNRAQIFEVGRTVVHILHRQLNAALRNTRPARGRGAAYFSAAARGRGAGDNKDLDGELGAVLLAVQGPAGSQVPRPAVHSKRAFIMRVSPLNLV
jgi:hypothetical protein